MIRLGRKKFPLAVKKVRTPAKKLNQSVKKSCGTTTLKKDLEAMKRLLNICG